jgi:gliding motility associated protien GldN
MNTFAKHIVSGIVIAMTASCITVASAQESVSSGVSRGQRTRPGQQQTSSAATTSGSVSTRLQQHYADSQQSDADVRWMRVIYRELDLAEENANAPLYYPEDLIDGNENLFRMMIRLIAENRVPAYEYLDGREVFTDQYRVKPGELFSRFDIPASPAKGYSEKNPVYDIEPIDVPTNEVLTYYVIERWTFDNRTNSMKTNVEAVCPVLRRTGDFGDDQKYPMFWMKMSDLKPYLQAQYVFTDDDNNLAKYTYDDFFTLNLYKGDIYKTLNLRNRSMAQLYPDPDDLKRAQDSIQNRLDHYADNLWVPTREELIAKREAAAAAADSIAAGNVTDSTRTAATKTKSTKTSSRSRSRRSSSADEATTSTVKTTKTKAPKASKSSSSSSATRSVRNRKR